MSLVIREDLSVPLPEAVAQEMGLHPGSPVRWERAADGGLTLRLIQVPEKAGTRLLGLLKPYANLDNGGVEEFLHWRDEDARLDGSL